MYNRDEASLFYSKAKNGLCSHAYIVDGAKGIGKLDFALDCARAMLCTEKDKPCGSCPSCKKALNDSHPDIHIIGKEKTATIGDVREIIRLASLKPNDGEKQIFIICNAGKLREDSQNSLLKLIEEPPETVAIFILTETRSALLPTVLSRGQRIHLDGMRDDELRQVLSEKYKTLSPREIEFAVDTVDGNLGEAEKYFSKENVALRNKAEKILTLALSKSSYELTCLMILPKYKREQLHAILSEFVFLVNEAQKQKYGVNKPRIIISEPLTELLKGVSKRALARFGDVALSCIAALEKSSNVTATASKFSVELIKAMTT